MLYCTMLYYNMTSYYTALISHTITYQFSPPTKDVRGGEGQPDRHAEGAQKQTIRT